MRIKTVSTFHGGKVGCVFTSSDCQKPINFYILGWFKLRKVSNSKTKTWIDKKYFRKETSDVLNLSNLISLRLISDEKGKLPNIEKTL